MKYYTNPYINYYVQLFKRTEFVGKSASYVASQAGKRWSSMKEKEKAYYYKMAEKAKEKKTNKDTGKGDKRTNSKTVIKQEGGESGSGNWLEQEEGTSCSLILLTPKREIPPRQATPRPECSSQLTSDACSNIYDLSTLKQNRTPQKRPGNPLVSRRLSFESESEGNFVKKNKKSVNRADSKKSEHRSDSKKSKRPKRKKSC